jgi:copper(I)-binding protein
VIKNVQINFLGLVIFLVLLAACDAAMVQNEPSFENAWIRALPPGVKMTAGFGTLTNPGSDPLEVASISSPSFGDVGLHRTEIINGISKMREVQPVVIDAGSRLVLEPGGYHLMLMMPAANIQAGQIITLNWTLADGRQFSFQVPVEKR